GLDGTDLWIDLRATGGAAGRSYDHLHRRHAGLHHHLHLDVLEVTLPSARIALGAAVGTHGDWNAGIGENFQIAIRLCERRLDGLSLFVIADLLLSVRIAEQVHLTAI